MQAKTSPYIYTDLSGLGQLKTTARENQQAAIKQIAKQFESLFMHMMLKSMRDASLGDPIFDSNQSMFYRDMFDNQLALSMSKGQGLGLADTLARQLQHQISPGKVQSDKQQSDTSAPLPASVPREITSVPVARTVDELSIAAVAARPEPQAEAMAEPVIVVNYMADEVPAEEPILPVDQIIDDEPISVTPIRFKTASPQSRQERFVGELWPHAITAADELDVDPEVLISQAALETGWGRHVIKGADGNNSFNLFNIKAGSDWDGKTVDKLTLEYRGGVPVWEKASFRAYDSYEESFRDYAEFLQSRDRYQGALAESDNPVRYMHELQRAGYATDPNYADKVINIMNREWDVFNKYSSLYESGYYDA